MMNPSTAMLSIFMLANILFAACAKDAPAPEPEKEAIATPVSKAFFSALPEGTLLNGIDNGNGSFTLRFSNGSSTTLSCSRSALLQVSSDGYWTVNGEKSLFRYASIPLYRIEEYGEAGISFAMQYDGGTLKPNGGFKIGTNGNNYNKIYFDISGNYKASQGEKLFSTVHWEIDYTEDYTLF